MKRISSLACLCAVLSMVAQSGDIKGKVSAKKSKDRANAVVYIEDIPGATFTAPTQPAMMDQKDLVFTPHVLPVMVGQQVDFRNSDDVLHNVFSPDKCANAFDLGTWPKGQVKSHTFDAPGCTPVLLCNVHPEMEAYILVVKTPYFAVSDKGGEYVIKDVPAGTYTLKVWHERLKEQEIEVTVPASGSVTVDFALKR